MVDSTLTTLERVHDPTVAAGGIADPAEATAWLVQHVAGAVEGDGAVMYVWHAASGQLRLRHSSGAPSAQLWQCHGPGKALADHAFLGGKPVVVEPGSPVEDLGPGSLPPGMLAAVAVPLRSTDQVSAA